jgi:hypothetical protein
LSQNVRAYDERHNGDVDHPPGSLTPHKEPPNLRVTPASLRASSHIVLAFALDAFDLEAAARYLVQLLVVEFG